MMYFAKMYTNFTNKHYKLIGTTKSQIQIAINKAIKMGDKLVEPIKPLHAKVIKTYNMSLYV